MDASGSKINAIKKNLEAVGKGDTLTVARKSHAPSQLERIEKLEEVVFQKKKKK